MILGYKVLASRVPKMIQAIFIAYKRSLGQGNIFTSMCHSFCQQGVGGSWFPSMHHRSHDQGDLYPGGLHPCIQGGLHPGRGLGRPPPPPSDTIGYGQQAGGTHPTGMHSCFKRFSSTNVSR